MKKAIHTLVHKESGTRHVAKSRFGNPVCGESPNRMKYENPSNMLAQFPEDFGLSPEDCDKCAEQDLEQCIDEFEESDWK